jgi:hypothetical protein
VRRAAAVRAAPALARITGRGLSAPDSGLFVLIYQYVPDNFDS